MIELVLTVCTIAHPETCVDQRMLFDQDNTPQECMASAPPYIAKWAAGHRKWFVRKWKCRYPRVEKDT